MFPGVFEAGLQAGTLKAFGSSQRHGKVRQRTKGLTAQTGRSAQSNDVAQCDVGSVSVSFESGSRMGRPIPP